MDKGQARYSPEFLAEKLGKFSPTAEQRMVIEAPLEPLLVVAGAGSGKTSTITDRIVWLVANGFVAQENILGVTFTRKAAGELATRVRRQLALLRRVGVELVIPEHAGLEGKNGSFGNDFGEPHISTYHAYAQSIVADYGMYLGIEPDSLLMSPSTSWQLANSVVEDYEGPCEHFTASSATLVQAIISLAAECAEHSVPAEEVRLYIDELVARLQSLPQDQEKKKNPTLSALKIIDDLRTQATLAGLVQEYQQAKKERSLLDFGDLIVYAARIAAEVPRAVDGERIKYQVVILDEFQDTSVAQLQLFSLLFGDGHAVTAVGDPQQSIYGFRGASAAGLYSFVDKFPKYDGEGSHPADIKYLLTSWRNDSAILEVANRLAAPLAASEYPVEVLAAAPQANAGAVSINYYTRNSSSDDVSSESEALAKTVGDLRESGIKAETYDAGPGIQCPSIAVLCRRRSQFGPLQQAFDKYGVPYEVIGLGGLLRTPEVIDLVSMLRVIADPSRSDSMMRLISGARFRLGAHDLMVLWEWAKSRTREASPVAANTDMFTAGIFDNASLVDILDDLPSPQWVSPSGRRLSDEAYRRLTRLNQDIRYLRAIDTQDLMLLIDETEKVMLLDVEVASKPGVNIHQARVNLDAFKQAAIDFLRQGEAFQSFKTRGSRREAKVVGWRAQGLRAVSAVDLTVFLSWLDAADEQENGLDMPPQPARPGVVQLLTVHASKGLEWDAVFVPGLAQGIFPSGRSVSWTGTASGSLPWALRGDYHAIKAWDWDTEHGDLKTVGAAWKEHREDSKYYAEREERRLAYVAATRAKSYLWLSSAAWYDGNSRLKEPSCYLIEAARLAHNYEDYEACTELSGTEEVRGFEGSEQGATTPKRDRHGISIGYWERNVPEKNPYESAPVPPVLWPIDPLRGRRLMVARAAEAVESYLLHDTDRLRAHLKDNEKALQDVVPYDQLELLLRKVVGQKGNQLYIPRHISASALVSLEKDPLAMVEQWQRPMPGPPSKVARAGTLFHQWVEDYLTSDIPLDIDVPEYKTAADVGLDRIFDISAMQENFLRSPWGHRTAHAVEEPIETIVASVVVRGKIDAVYREQQDDGTDRWEIVDWKTGAVPRSDEELAEKAIQLSLYRLAYAKIHSIVAENIGAAFYYVKENRVIRPRLFGEEELDRLVRGKLAMIGVQPGS